MGTQVMSVEVSDDALALAKRLAPILGFSVEEMLSRLLDDAVNEESSYWQAAAREIEEMRRGDLFHTGGNFNWTREELNERRRTE